MSTLPTLPVPLTVPGPTKRKRPAPSALTHSSNLFHPYRSIGHIVGPQPFHLSSLGSARFLHAATGRTFSIYNLDRLRTVLTSQPSPHPIASITAAGRDLTAVTASTDLLLYRRAEVVQRIRAHDSAVYLVRTWGKDHLLTVDQGQVMRLWDMRKLSLGNEREYGAWETVKPEDADPIPMDTADDAPEGRDDAAAGIHPACVASISLHAFELPAAGASPATAIHLPSSSRLTCVLHPPTFVNKVLLAFNTGLLLLYNLHTRSAIHAYYPITTYLSSTSSSSSSLSSSSPTALSSSPSASASPHSSSSITALAASPSPGVVSVGTASGLIVQFSIDSSTVLSAFHQHWGEVTALSYRTDGWPHLLSATKQGHVLTWHLGDWEETGEDGPGWRRRPGFHAVAQWCHEGEVVCASYLPHEPIVVTSGKDNALRMYSVEGAEGSMRLLKARTGHSRHPHFIRWLAREETNKASDAVLLTGGENGSMRLWSLRRDEESRELGRRKVAPRSRRQLMIDEAPAQDELPAVTSFAVSMTPRAKDYANVLSVHAGDAAARGWSTETASVSALSFVNPLEELSVAKSVDVSACGQWGIVGRADGRVEMYAMESGNYRGAFPDKSDAMRKVRPRKGQLHTLDDLVKGEAVIQWGSKPAATVQEAEKPPVQGGHTAAVTGVQMDGTNQWLITGSLDATVKAWDVASRTCVHTLRLSSGVSRLVYHRDNDLFAVATDAYELLVYDNSSTSPSSAPTLVRRFLAHSHPITDVAFSPRGHLLLSASLGGVVVVHHLPGSVVVDVLRFNAPVVSLAMSPLGDMIATAHVGSVGVMVWMSKEWVGDGWDEVREGEQVDLDDDDEEDEAQGKAVQPVMEVKDEAEGEREEGPFGLITFSSLPRSRWHALLHLDELKERNRGKEADITRNPAAPFFLSTLDMDPTQTAPAPPPSSTSKGRILRTGASLPTPAIIPLLSASRAAAMACDGSALALYDAYLPVTRHLLELSTAALDAMIGLMAPHERQREWFVLWLEYFTAVGLSVRHYEFLQSVLGRMLRVHGTELMSAGDEVRTLLGKLSAVQRKGWERLERALLKNTALVNHLTKLS